MGVFSRAALKYALVSVLSLGCEAAPAGDDRWAPVAEDGADSAAPVAPPRSARAQSRAEHHPETAPSVGATEGPALGALDWWPERAPGAGSGATDDEGAPGGDLPEGRAPGCTLDEDCSLIQVCNLALSDRGGVCVKRGIAGGRCAEDADCHATLACGVAADAPYAVCTLPAAAGAPCFTTYGCGGGLACVKSGYQTRCTDGAEGSPCEKQPQCDPGMYCIPSTSEFGSVCGHPREAGASCGMDVHCAGALRCFVPPKVAVGVCGAPHAAGELCYSPSQCVTGLVCHPSHEPLLGKANGVCGPPSQAGDTCVAGWDCSEGHVCDSYFTPPRCGPEVLKACKSHDDCAPGQLCSGLDEAGDSAGTDSPSQSGCGWLCEQCVLVPGSVADYGACGLDQDCALASYCSFEPGDHRCLPRGEPGEPCTSPTGCVEGAWCGPSGTCLPPSSVLGPCVYQKHCEAGLLCHYSGKCLRPLLAECNDDAACGPGMECVTSLGGATGTCKSTANTAVGDDCIGNPIYLSTTQPALCSQCLPKPGVLLPTEPCISAVDCGPGTTCRAYGECGPPGQAGELCTTDADCDPGALLCVSSVCVPPVLDGGLCTESHACADGLACIEWACVLARAEGEPCASQAHCADGLKCKGPESEKTCQVLGPLGEPCTVLTDCESGMTCGSDGACRAPAATGDDCLADSDCASWLECQVPSWLGEKALGVCAGKIGAPCLDSADCLTNFCTGSGICSYWCD